MIGRLKDLAKRHWPLLRLRTILIGVLLFVAAMPVFGAVFLRLYENTLVRQTEAELVVQGAALVSTARSVWPAASPRPAALRTTPGYYRQEPPNIDLSSNPILAERRPRRVNLSAAQDARVAARFLAPVFEQTSRTSLASLILLDRRGIVTVGADLGDDYGDLPEIRSALAGRPMTVLRHNDNYRAHYSLEWLSRASQVRIHHARPIRVGDQTVGVILLSRSPRGLFREAYEDRVKFALGLAVILSVLVVLAGLVSRGVTRPIEALSRATRDVAAGQGAVPETPATAAVEIQQLYEDFRVMAGAIAQRSQYLRDFAASLSHEFKTPLAGITGAAELLDDHVETMTVDERRRFLSNIRADSGRLSQLVSRLLDLARADMTQAQSGLSTELALPVQRITDALATTDFQVENRIAKSLPPVAAPASVIEAVLANLIENSRQAGAAQVIITSSTGQTDVALTVQDDGPGIPQADRERLFEPFFTSRRSAGGSGLGLPITRSLLAAHRGAVDLVSSQHGASFVIRLPRAVQST